MDAITLLKQDHRKVEELFEKYEKLGKRAFKSKQRLAMQIVRELELHAAIEERHVYPNAEAVLPSANDLVLESYEEHHVVKFLMEEIEVMDATGERYDAKLTVLKELVQHHVEEEEKELFPKLKKALDKAQLADLAYRLQETKDELMSTAEKGTPRVSITLMDAKQEAKRKSK